MTPTAKASAYREATRDLLRASLLDAAGELMQDAPWTEISMAAIATQAGVSRQTLYNEFGSRDVFAQTFALRAADRFLVEVEEAFTSSPDDPYRALSLGFARFLELAATDPMVRHIVVRDPGADELLHSSPRAADRSSISRPNDSPGRCLRLGHVPRRNTP
jgi:AcrR family transcriptional regulator